MEHCYSVTFSVNKSLFRKNIIVARCIAIIYSNAYTQRLCALLPGERYTLRYNNRPCTTSAPQKEISRENLHARVIFVSAFPSFFSLSLSVSKLRIVWKAHKSRYAHSKYTRERWYTDFSAISGEIFFPARTHTNAGTQADPRRPWEQSRDKPRSCLDADMNNVSHGVAGTKRCARGKGGRKEEIRVGYTHRIMKATIYDRE